MKTGSNSSPAYQKLEGGELAIVREGLRIVEADICA